MEQLDDLNLESGSSIKPPTLFQMVFDRMVKDMRFVGMFTIIYGAINCLTIFGAIIGIPTIIIGLRMRESADQFTIFKATNDSAAMRMGFELQGKYFRIIKILMIIGLVLTVIFIILFATIILSGIGALMNMQSYN